MTDPRDRLIASAIGVLVCGITLAYSTQLGITRDEAYYMKAGERYLKYYEDALTGRLQDPFSARSIEPYWNYNTEHPPLIKLLYGASWRVLHQLPSHGASVKCRRHRARRMPCFSAGSCVLP